MTTYGTGICTDDIKHMTVDGIKELVSLIPMSHKHKALMNAALLDARDEGIDTPDGLAEYLGQGWQNYEEVGIATVLAVVINACENVQMLPTADTNGYTFLILEEKAPWKYNTREKHLTEEELIAIIGRYVRVLTTELVPVEHIAVEND